MGMAALEVVGGYGQQVRPLQKAYSMDVMRKKTPNTYGARLGARGDLARESEAHSSSAPTSNRRIIRAVVCVAEMFTPQLGTSDVTQSYPKAYTAAFGGRGIIFIPARIRIPPQEKLRDKEGKTRGVKEEEVDIADCGKWQRPTKDHSK